MPPWELRPGARTGGRQGTGATLVATNAATRLPRLFGLPEQNFIFLSVETIAKMPALVVLSPLKSQKTLLIVATVYRLL